MSGRILKWAGIVLFLATIGVMGLYFSSLELDQADQTASVVGAFSGVLGLALACYGMFASRAAPTPASAEDTLAAAKKALASAVSQQWRTEATIRSLDDPEPIPVSWSLVNDAGLMDHPRLVGEHLLTFTGSSDQVPKLARAFRALARRRLVIAGGLGTGKTTLAIQLLLELLSSGADTADPVPVLLPVNGWDTAAHPRLHDWLAARLAVDYPALNAAEFGTNAAKALVTHGHILPVLDGLDEIPEPARAAVISALNRWLAKGDQFILTSRTTEYAAAIEQSGDVLTAAAVIAPAAITPADAETYLRTTLPPVPRHDWTPIWAALHSASCPGLSRLAETALGLWLIRTVYIPAADPAPLTGPQAQQETTLRAHLLDHLIPAVIDSRPPSRDPAEHFRPRTAWNPDHARAHLAYLARVLQQHNTYDLAWWQLAQHAIPHAARRRTARQAELGGVLAFGLTGGLVFGIYGGLVFGLAFGLAFGFAGGLMGGFVSRLAFGRDAWFIEQDALLKWDWIGFALGLVGGPALGRALGLGLGLGLVDGLMLGLAIGLPVARALVYIGERASKRSKWFTETPGYADLHLSGRTTDLIKYVQNALAKWVGIGIEGGIMGGFAFRITFGITDGYVIGARAGLAAGLGVGFAEGVIKWAEQPASSTVATTPPTSWKADRTLTLLRVITLTLTIGFALGLVGAITGGLGLELVARTGGGIEVWIMSWLMGGLMGGLAIGLTLGNHHAWLAYTITAWRLAKEEHLPRNLMAFLDDAHRLGLLRTVGPIYQFRHAELQDHLAALPPPGSKPINTTTTPRSTKNAN